MKTRTRITATAMTAFCSAAGTADGFHVSMHMNMGMGMSSRTSSAFMPRNAVAAPLHATSPQSQSQSRQSWVMYDASHQDHNKNNLPAHQQNSDVIWSSLANTERWMQKTLGEGKHGPDSDTSPRSPYARKDVSYVCETSSTVEEIVAGLFRRLREVREIGAAHGATEEQVRIIQGSKYKARTHRQTLVVVAPSNVDINQSFSVFDSLIQTINEARRNARDYYTAHDRGMESDDESDEETPKHLKKEEWVTSVNLGHMHPSFGLYTDAPAIRATSDDEEELAAMDLEPDAATKEYLARRLLAQRSPYPSMVIEVRSTPPFDMPQGENKEFKSQQRRNHPREEQGSEGGAGDVSMDDVKRLEALFGKGVSLGDGDDGLYAVSPGEYQDPNASSISSASTSSAASLEEELWDKLAESQAILEVSLLSPEDQAQQWVIDQDEDYCPEWSSFAFYDTHHVDAAYEFVFSSIAFQRNRDRVNAESAAAASSNGSVTTPPPIPATQPYQTGFTAWKANANISDAMLELKRDYLLLPHFLSKAATSFEKFATQVQNIVNVIPIVSDYLTVSTFHPEHVDKEKRSPVPILVLEWMVPVVV